LLSLASPVAPLGAQAPSQRELNGFLLDQSGDAVAASFAQVLKVDTMADHWVYRVYGLDRSHHAYMAFKFPPDRPKQAVSLQITGDSGTTMHPFLGLVLGDHYQTVLKGLGDPTVIRHELDLNLDLYVYDGRNYSLELDSLGRLWSIEIFAYTGLPDRPKETVPSLDSLAAALEAGGDTALQYLAPDLEIYEKGHTHSFLRAALTEVEDDTSTMARLLFHDAKSAVAVLRDPSTRVRAEANIRVWERRSPGWVFKLPRPTPIAEVVYINHAGRWRLWEIRYR